MSFVYMMELNNVIPRTFLLCTGLALYYANRLHLEYLTLATTRESPSHESHRSHFE